MDQPIKIHPAWDAALTYEDLLPADNAASGPAFVGRSDLLDIIIGAIRQPDRRGTFLVSGYRGAGKTTLLIEAMRRTVQSSLLPKGWQLWPLVLNASEVSASLPAATAGGAPATGPAGAQLRIGSQQLLTALIRTLRNHAAAHSAGLPEALATAIGETYRKATAKEYSRSEGSQSQQVRTLTRDYDLKLTTADAYKSLSGAGAAAAVIIEGGAWLSSWATALHAVAVGVGALAVVSWTASRKLNEVAKQESNEAVSVKFDNSLQQLEGDLKELLVRLHTENRRVVVVLEELDKIRDEEGEQLDEVIRYFKNLFTQAPALFFFVTDKAYYDFIAGKIRHARRQRSYAIEHTFFTHRLFVGRPTTRDCLSYLKTVLLDEPAGKELDQLYIPGGIPPFSPAIAESPLLRLVRYLLFQSSHHLFDLKNELRRFVHTNGSDLVLDPTGLSEDDVAVGVFQDLVVHKYGLFAFRDGRPYVNEVLNDCLYAIFNDLGADAVQQVRDYYPRALAAALAPTSETPAPVPAVAARVAEDQLELSEQLRIKDAVDSLIEDLHRGGAFEADRTNITQGQFVWKRNAAHSFRFLRRLERHETALVERLEKLQAAMQAFATGGPLADLAGVQNDADAFLHDLEDTKRTVQTTDHTLTVDDTDKRDLQWQQRAAEPIARAYRAHLDRVVNRYGLQFEPIGSSVEGGTLSLLRASFGDPRSQEGQLGAAVLLAQGEGGRLDDDVREFVGRAPRLSRLAIVHVMHAPGEPTALTAREEQWRRQLADEMQWRVADGRPRALVVQALALDEGWPEDVLADCWGDKLAERLLFHTGWGGLAVKWNIVSHDVTLIMASVNDQPDHQPFVAAITAWLRGQQRVLHILLDGSLPRNAENICLAALAGIDTPEVIGYGLGTEEPVPLKVLSERVQQTVGIGQDKDSRVPAVVARLVEQCEIIPVVDTTDQKPPSNQWLIRLLGNQGRAIVIAPSSWRPPEYGDGPELTFTTLRIEESPAAKV